jgi:tetratricopeptide (TPR) repeat protein
MLSQFGVKCESSLRWIKWILSLRAIQDFSIVIRLSPQDEAAYYWRGVSYDETGQQDEAIADYRQFLETSQDWQTKYEIEQKLSQLDTAKLSSMTQSSDTPSAMGEIR